MTDTTIPLSAPVTATDDSGNVITLTALTLRAPTGRDLRICGVPMTMAADGSNSIDAEAVSRLIGALAGQPAFVVDRLPAADWMAAMRTVVGFFRASAPVT